MTEQSASNPELIIGLVGPIGCDIERVQNAVMRSLRRVSYTTHLISFSNFFAPLLKAKGENIAAAHTLREKIRLGTDVRRLYQANGVLAAKAIAEIRGIRRKVNIERNVSLGEGDSYDDSMLPATCYLLRQLKRPEEVNLLRKTYGSRFIQISINQDRVERFNNLTHLIRRENPGWTLAQVECEARDLIRTDENEEANSEYIGDVKRSSDIVADYGQKVSEIFHSADVFISSSSNADITSHVDRFVDALFGKNDISPTRAEVGSYFAKAASLRSADLSRQVGAAIFTAEGDIISVGCNEVPKANGGAYWYEDEFKARDIDRGSEANKEETNRIVHSFLKVLAERNLLRTDATPENTPTEILSGLGVRDAIFESMIGDITEYGRMVHAEMAAITDAARLGRALRGAVMYVTTFPCHNCAKHIIASGIAHVVFIEPYEKSRTALFYSDSTSMESEKVAEKVKFSHFEGISPRRYRDIFEKGRRRTKDWKIQEWYEGRCAPRFVEAERYYVEYELYAIAENLSGVLEDEDPATTI